jgi:hypothetical protein
MAPAQRAVTAVSGTPGNQIRLDEFGAQLVRQGIGGARVFRQ